MNMKQIEKDLESINEEVDNKTDKIANKDPNIIAIRQKKDACEQAEEKVEQEQYKLEAKKRLYLALGINSIQETDDGFDCDQYFESVENVDETFKEILKSLGFSKHHLTKEDWKYIVTECLEYFERDVKAIQKEIDSYEHLVEKANDAYARTMREEGDATDIIKDKVERELYTQFCAKHNITSRADLDKIRAGLGSYYWVNRNIESIQNKMFPEKPTPAISPELVKKKQAKSLSRREHILSERARLRKSKNKIIQLLKIKREELKPQLVAKFL